MRPTSSNLSYTCRQWSFTSIVTYIILLLMLLGAISLSALYFFTNWYFISGQTQAEAVVSAELISVRFKLWQEMPVSNETYPNNLIGDDWRDLASQAGEAREILDPIGKLIYRSGLVSSLKWPVVSAREPVLLDGETVAYMLVHRSLSGTVMNSAAMLMLGLLCCAGLGLLLKRTLLSKLHRIESSMVHSLSFDSLTGLPNRNVTLQELGLRLASSIDRFPILLFIDLDRFKLINDNYGHAIGDEVLIEAARRLRRCLAPGDHLGRMSGDGFGIIRCLSPDELSSHSDSLCSKVLQALSTPHLCNGQEVLLSATIGVATGDSKGISAHNMMRQADTALHSRKASARGGWKLYSPEMSASLERESNLRRRLSKALQRNEFELHYQPIVRLQDSVVIGAEALIRWRQAETGALTSPAEFIPLLEDSGMINAVGDWVIQTACLEVALWRKRYPEFYVAVNVSARQFTDERFVATVETALQHAKIDPSSLELELTESMLFDDSVVFLEKIRKLKASGIKLALDDFGTGFSSLSRLSAMPFDVVKIDRQFIGAMHSGEREHAVLASIISMTKALGMKVVAEGVEESRQIDGLIRLGSESGQGYIFSRPLPAPEFRSTFLGDSFKGSRGDPTLGNPNGNSSLRVHQMDTVTDC